MDGQVWPSAWWRRAVSRERERVGEREVGRRRRARWRRRRTAGRGRRSPRRPARPAPSPRARLVAIVVFPAPPFGHSDMIDAAAVVVAAAVSRRRRTRWRRWVAASNARSIAARRSAGAMSGAITSRAPARERRLQEIGRRRGHDHDADVGTVVVERGGEGERTLFGRDVGPEGDDFDAAVRRARARRRRVDEHVLAPVAQRAVELAVERVPHPLFEVGVCGCEHQPAHAALLIGSFLHVSRAAVDANLCRGWIDRRAAALRETARAGRPSSGGDATARQARLTRDRRAAKHSDMLMRPTTSDGEQRPGRGRPSASPTSTSERRPSSR